MAKNCPKCNTIKENDSFSKGSSGKLNSWCKDCKNKIFKQRRNNPDKDFHKKEADRIFSYTLKTRYGITLEDYNNLLILQNGKCAICNQPNPFSKHGRFAVDHCHTSGKVRGLLCHNCNIGLGQFKDNIELLSNAMKYLDYNKGKSVRKLSENESLKYMPTYTK